jgi:hypothetical protein
VKRRLLISVVTLILVLIPFGGCSGVGGGNYVTVVVQTKACVTVEYLVEGNTNHTKWAGGPLHIEINEAGGERVTFEKTTDAGGCTEVVTGTFKLYKEQPVTVIATITGSTVPVELGGGPWDPAKYDVVNNFDQLTWAEIDAMVDFGDTYDWNPVLEIVLKNKEISE